MRIVFFHTSVVCIYYTKEINKDKNFSFNQHLLTRIKSWKTFYTFLQFIHCPYMFKIQFIGDILISL